ncbi:50S ribosomal protein L19 [Candidatus Margulisiibacteriota bacterium]
MKNNITDKVEKAYLKDPKQLPRLKPGDKVSVYVKIIEQNKERIQRFEGTVMKVANRGINKNFTVRRVVSGIGVERTFYFNSPKITDIKVKSSSKVRRSRLYYVRNLTGKATRLTTLYNKVEKAEQEVVEEKKEEQEPSDKEKKPA